MSNYAEQFAMSKYASGADRSAAMLAELGHLALDLHTERAAVVALTLELANARAVDIHSCHDGCTRSGCVAGRLTAERDALREDVARLTKIIDDAWGDA